MLKFFRKYLAFNAAIFVSISSLAETVQLKESDLPKLIETRNSRALGARDHVISAEKRTGHLMRSYLPKIDARVGSETFKTGTFDEQTQTFGGVEAALNIFNSGNDKLEENIREEQLLAAQARSSQALRDEISKARKAYWTLVFQKELQSIVEEALKGNEKNLSSANGRIRAGSATDTDRLEFEMYRVELEQDLARTKLSIESLKRELGTLLNMDSTNFETPTVVDHQHDDKILSSTLSPSENPEVSNVTSQANIASLKRSQARRSWLPRVDLFANQFLYTFREREYTSQDDRWESVLGIQLSMQLFNGGNSLSESASFAAESTGLGREAAQTRLELKNRFETAKAELKLIHQLVHDSEGTLQRSSRYFSRSMDEYRRGVKNSLDILNVSQRTLSVRKRYVELRRDYQLQRADLLAALSQ